MFKCWFFQSECRIIVNRAFKYQTHFDQCSISGTLSASELYNILQLHSLLQIAATPCLGFIWHLENENLPSDLPWQYEAQGKLKRNQQTCSSVTLFCHAPVVHISRDSLVFLKVSFRVVFTPVPSCLQRRARHAALWHLYLSTELPCPHPPRTRDRERLQRAAAVCAVMLQGQGFLPLNPGTISAESCDWDKRDLLEHFV